MGAAQDEPISAVQAEAERRLVVEEIVEIQNWLSGRDVRNVRGTRISSVTYHVEREKKCTRLTRLQQRAGYLRTWISDYHRANGPAGHHERRHPHERLLAQLFHAVCDLQEGGVVVGSRVESVLNEIEMTVPPKTLLLEGDVP